MTDRRPIEVAGVGQTGPVAEDPRSIPEMVLEAVQAALGDAGIGFPEVDSVVTASVDLWDGLTASNIAVTEVVGAVMGPETRIAADGLAAVVQAACQIWSGAYRTVLVVAHGKPSMAPYQQLTRWALDPVLLQPLGVDFQVLAALQAQAVAGDDREAPARWAAVVERRRADAGGDGVAGACSARDVLASPVVASPLTALMAAPLADGACAVVLRGAGDASAGDRPGVWLSGVGHHLCAPPPGGGDLSRWAGLEAALERACSLAFARQPAPTFDLLEPSCLYPHEEELFAAAVAPAGGATLSPGGGLFAGAVPVAAGLTRLVAGVRTLQSGRAGRCLAHGSWGPAGQAHAVAILEAS